MKNIRIRTLMIFSSITAGIGGFLLTVPLTIFLGALLIGPSEGRHAFFSAQEATLFLISILVGLLVAVILGIKYYQYQRRSK